MIRRVLFLVMISVSSYAQDTLAVIDAKYKPRDQEIFIHGDSTFIRLVYSDAYAPWSTAGWYSSGRQLAEVNLEILASRKLLGVQRFGDTVYYYGYTAQARKTTVTTVRLVGVSEPVKIGEQTVEGTLLGIKERGRNLSLVTLDRKGKKFKVFELRKGKATAAGELSYTWKIENIGLNDISFQDASGSWGSCSINVQLHGNTLAAVFDDRNPNAEDPVATRRTLIIRKDLVTGKPDAEGFRIIDEPGTSKRLFKSALSGNLLYRLLQTKDDWKVIVQNLDDNCVEAEFDLPAVEATYAHGDDDPVKPRKIDDAMDNYRKDANAVALQVRNFGTRKLIEIQFKTYVAMKVHVFGLVPGTGPTADFYSASIENLFIGSPTEGFSPIDTRYATAAMQSRESEERYAKNAMWSS